MKENIWHEFPCRYCEEYHTLAHSDFVGCGEVQHYHCNCCRKSFYMIFDFDYRLAYINEEDL